MTTLAAARRWIDDATRVVALTGAGISTESGIPDFRGPQGVWTRDPKAEKLSNIHSYMSDPEVRRLAWQSRLDHPAWHAEPNAAHRALVRLEHTGRLLGIATQNIDRLHQRAGSSADMVVELHGAMFDTVCLDCGDTRTMREALDRVADGDPDPRCASCGGILKSATISFGQALDPAVLDKARRLALECDLLLAVGTSLGVYPAAGLVDIAAQVGAPVIICNATPTPYDELAAAVVRDPIGTALPALVGEE